MFNRPLLLLSSTLLLSACASSYKVPELADTANITIKHSLPMYPSSTTVNIFDNQECVASEQSGRLAKVGNDSMIKDKVLTVQVEAGEPVFLASHLWKESGSERHGYLSFHCSNLISFTPKKNTDYVLKARALKNARCEIELLEKHSKKVPAGIKKYKSKEACNKTGFLDL
ncbi:MAG: hypothetical protein HRU20_08165 [Pseudomonadales bacterium]|nr:hypothetical protein [Pseudomonadales bacterium]